MSRQIALALALIALPLQHASASKGLWEEYDKLIRSAETIGTVGPEQFGEQVNIQRGALSMRVTDVSLPGNNGLPVSFTRTFVTKTNGGAMRGTTPQQNARDGALADWEIELPHVGGIFPTQTGWANGNAAMASSRCTAGLTGPTIMIRASTFSPHEYSQGVTLNLPGTGAAALLQPSAQTVRPSAGARYITAGMVAINCLPAIKNGTGEGFIATTPDGTRYWFDWMAMAQEQDLTKSFVERGINPWEGGADSYRTVYDHLPRGRFGLFATRVEDRFGNWVSYSYSNGATAPVRLNRVASSDGRIIDVDYHASGRVQAVRANGRQWQYSYSGDSIWNASLNRVTLPDGSKWELNLQSLQSLIVRYYMGAPDESWRNCTNPGDIDERTYVGTVRHPSGATAEYTLFPTRFNRLGIDYQSNCSIGDPNTTNDDVEWRPSAWDSYALVKKRVMGAGLTDQVWDYVYESGNRTTITGPSEFTRYTFGNTYRVNEGKLLSLERGSGADGILHREDYTYELAQSGMPYPTPIGVSQNPRADDFTDEFVLPQKRRTTTRDGATFSIEVNEYDAFARPVSVRKASSLGYQKTEAHRFLDDTSAWVLALPLSNSVNGRVVTSLEYDERRQLRRRYEFGALAQTLTYNPDGTIATATDARGNTTAILGWKRGIPLSIRYPATPEAPTGALESAVVDDNGWVTAMTNEAGVLTQMGYDPMGRLSTINRPSSDGSTYHGTYREFRALTTNDWVPAGFAPGQWRLYEQTGNHLKVTYFDALWRAQLIHEYDTTRLAETLRSIRKDYDGKGRLAFESYPSSDTYPPAVGTRTSYDAIDRVLEILQDSELGTLQTRNEYLSGFRMRSTNPRGYATTTSFMAFDEPTIDHPVISYQPGGRVIEIERDPGFSWPLALTQRSSDGGQSVTRRYVYDTQGRVCKTIEPETGITVLDYDENGLLKSSAGGLVGGAYASLQDCNRAAASQSGRVVQRTYDSRSRITAIQFPDGLGNQQITYEADGLIASITAQNGAGGAQSVVSRYAYNGRRLLASETLQQPGWYEWTLAYRYDAMGSLASHTYPTGLTVDYAPNALGQATRAGTFATDARYFPNGALKQFTYGNGIVHTMVQNVRQLPRRVTSSGVLDLEYYYDRHGNPEHIANALIPDFDPRDRWMQYDALDRLTAAGSASFGGDHWHRMTYDALDNLTSWKLAGVKDFATYRYNGNQQVTQIQNSLGGTELTFGYDAQGNVTQRNGQTYVFDFGNRLRSAAGLAAYRYDGNGRRVQSTGTNGATSLWMYGQSGQLMFSSDWGSSGQQDQKTHEYVHLAGSLVATIDHAWPSNTVLATRYQHTDALGSPVAVTNAQGQVIERTDFEPYGAAIANPGYRGIGFAGHVFDHDTGLSYMQQRYYDAAVGRFLSVDPIAATGNTGANFNRYWYANGNPYRMVDPDGRQAIDALLDVRARPIDPEIDVRGKISAEIKKYVTLAVEGNQNQFRGVAGMKFEGARLTVGSDGKGELHIKGMPYPLKFDLGEGALRPIEQATKSYTVGGKIHAFTARFSVDEKGMTQTRIGISLGKFGPLSPSLTFDMKYDLVGNIRSSRTGQRIDPIRRQELYDNCTRPEGATACLGN